MRRRDFDPDQPRDDHGRWTSGGGAAAAGRDVSRAVSGARLESGHGAINPERHISTSALDEHVEDLESAVRDLESFRPGNAAYDEHDPADRDAIRQDLEDAVEERRVAVQREAKKVRIQVERYSRRTAAYHGRVAAALDSVDALISETKTTKDFDPSEPRDDHGRWTSEGGGLTGGEAYELHQAFAVHDLTTDRVQWAHDDLEQAGRAAQAAEENADSAQADNGGNPDPDAEEAAVDAQRHAAEAAVVLHGHLQNLIDRATAARDDLESRMGDYGIRREKSGRRRFGIERKFCPIEKASPSLGDRQILIIASDPTPDLAKDVMVPDGCDIASYQMNPIVLAQHNHEHPIGKAHVAIKNGRVEALIEFAPAGVSAKADEYCGLAKAGIINTASVGFEPIERTPNKNGGYRYDKWQLLEISLVSVPCNQSAVVISRSAERKGRPERVHKAVDWKVGASRNLPVSDETSWDGAAAEAAIFERAGFAGDKPDISFARKGFLCYDAAAPKEKGSYKLPFATMKDGRLTVTAGALRAAVSRLPQADIPDDVRTKARAVIDHYRDKLGLADGEGDNGKAASMNLRKIKAAIVRKGLYDVAQLACVLDNLRCMTNSAAWEAEMEGDGSNVPAMLADGLHKLADAFLAMTSEEVEEMLATVQPKARRAAVQKARRATKSGRRLSKASLDQIDAIEKCMKGIEGCHGGMTDLHEKGEDNLDALRGHLDDVASRLAAGRDKPGKAAIADKPGDAIAEAAKANRQAMAVHLKMADAHDEMVGRIDELLEHLQGIGGGVKALRGEAAGDDEDAEDGDAGGGDPGDAGTGKDDDSDKELAAKARRKRLREVEVMRLRGAA